ncbi:MAG: cyclase family protein [Haliscomenobacter sp.]
MINLEAYLEVGGQRYKASMMNPLDISIVLRPGSQGVNCFYAPFPEASPVVFGDFTGDTRQGGAVNFFNLRVNPHGNGTHTECVGHISIDRYAICDCLRQFHFFAVLHSFYPRRMDNGDRVVVAEDLDDLEFPKGVGALVIRTLPNDALKLTTNYSGANPPFLEEAFVQELVRRGIRHLVLDLPSVDKEEDGGRLAAHRAFWSYPENIRTDCTITELAYIRPDIPDGLYLLNLQITSIELDVSMSKPVLYPLFLCDL